jgi:hypothetical protein
MELVSTSLGPSDKTRDIDVDVDVYVDVVVNVIPCCASPEIYLGNGASPQIIGYSTYQLIRSSYQW